MLILEHRLTLLTPSNTALTASATAEPPEARIDELWSRLKGVQVLFVQTLRSRFLRLNATSSSNNNTSNNDSNSSNSEDQCHAST